MDTLDDVTVDAGHEFNHKTACRDSAHLTRLHSDCFQHLLLWLDSHQLCKLFWCGDTQLERYVKTCMLDWKIRLMDATKCWSIPDFVCTQNVASLELSSDKCFFSLDQVQKLSASLKHLHIRRRGKFDKDTSTASMLGLNMAETFPLLQSFSLLLNPSIWITAEFLGNFGNQLSNLNLHANRLVLEDVQYLPRSLTSLKCALHTSDYDLDITNPLFPPDLTRLVITRHFYVYEHMVQTFMDPIIRNLPVHLQVLELDLTTERYQCLPGTAFVFNSTLPNLQHLQSLVIRSTTPCVFVALPLPIPPSATSIEYYLQYQSSNDYPLQSTPSSNLKRLCVDGFLLKHDYVCLLPTSIEVLYWQSAWYIHLPHAMWRHMPRNLKGFHQFTIDDSEVLDTTEAEYVEFLKKDLPASFEDLQVCASRNATLANLPSNLVYLTLPIAGETAIVGFPPDANYPKLESLSIASKTFNVLSICNISSARLDKLSVQHDAISISTFPFDAPCLQNLTSLDIWFPLPLAFKSDMLSFVTTFKTSLVHLREFKFDRSARSCPAWFFAYLPRNLVRFSAYSVYWTDDLVSYMASLPNTLESLSISFAEAGDYCTINVTCVEDSFLPRIKTLKLFWKCPRRVIDFYNQFLEKMSSRKRLYLYPACGQPF